MSPCACCGLTEGVVRKIRDVAGRIVTTWCPRCDQLPQIPITT